MFLFQCLHDNSNLALIGQLMLKTFFLDNASLLNIGRVFALSGSIILYLHFYRSIFRSPGALGPQDELIG